MARFTAKFYRDTIGDTSTPDKSFDASSVADADKLTAELLLWYNTGGNQQPGEEVPTTAQLTDSLTSETYDYAVADRACVRRHFLGGNPFTAAAP